jgi:hypothetical protein
MSDVTKNVRDEFADAAAANAIGAGTADDRALAEAPATDEEKKIERELREVAARMAAASPYMEPSEDVRARIMAETSPSNYKMSDYKKANGEAKWWRYGLIAAVLFLVAAAYWNMEIKNQLAKSEAQTAAARQIINDQNKALSMIADPKTTKAALKVNDKVAGAVLLDEENQIAVVVAPTQLFPQGKVPQFEMTVNGHKKTYRTIPVVYDGLGESKELAGGKTIEVRFYKSDDKSSPVIAGWGQ